MNFVLFSVLNKQVMRTFVTMIIHVDIMIMIVKNQELFIIDVFQGLALL